MARDWIDAEFEIVGPLRLGDPHPDHTTWRYAGLDPNGRRRWRKPPLFSRLQLFLALVAASPFIGAAVYLVASLFDHH